jgi:hypothetical protein
LSRGSVERLVCSAKLALELEGPLPEDEGASEEPQPENANSPNKTEQSMHDPLSARFFTLRFNRI